MSSPTSVPRSEFILGGQRSGKSRRAETLAQHWLQADAQHHAVMVATARIWDEEMRLRIARHQADRTERVPGMHTVEEPLALAAAVSRLSQPDTLVVVDCLTLWLTNLLMPLFDSQYPTDQAQAETAALATEPIRALLCAIEQAPGPVVIVGNEIGMGVIPMGAQVRAFVDQLGRLNQDMARVCSRVTLMAAGLALTLKDTP